MSSPDTFGCAYGVALIAGGLLGYFRSGSLISVLLGVITGAWTTYNAMHPHRQNNVANLAIATVLCVIMILRVLFSGKYMPAAIIAILSGIQAMRMYPHLAK